MTYGKLPHLILVFFFLIHADPFASLQVYDTTPALNVATCEVSNCSTMPPTEAWGRSSGQNIFLANIAGIICCVAIVKNCIVLFTIKKDCLLRLPQNYFFISLTVADLLTALVSMPVFTQYVLLGRWELSDNLCNIWIMVDWTLRLGSLYLRVLITIDKFLSAKYPTRYMVWRCPLKAKIAICCAWMIPAIVIFIYVFAGKDSDASISGICEMPFMEYKTTAFYLSVLYFWVPLLLIGALYCKLYATSYATYKRYERLRKSWNVKNKRHQKLCKAGKNEKYSTKECKPLSDSSNMETIDLQKFDVVTSSSTDQDLFCGNESASHYVTIEKNGFEPSVNVNTALAPYCSPIIKITSPAASEHKIKDTQIDDDLISSDEEFMQRLYNATERYPVDDVQGSQEFTGPSLLERKYGSKDNKYKSYQLTSLEDSSDSEDSDDIHRPQSFLTYFETVPKEPRSYPEKDLTKAPVGPSRKTESRCEQSQDEKHRDYVIAAHSGRNLKDQESNTCNVLHIKSYSGDESAKATVYSVKSPEQRAAQRQHPDDEENFNIPIDAGKSIQISKSNHEHEKINEYFQSAQELSDKTRYGGDCRKTKLCVAQSSVRPLADIKSIQRNKGTNDKGSSRHIDHPNIQEGAIRKFDNMQKKLPMSSIPPQLPEKYNTKDSKLKKKFTSNVECNRNEIALEFIRRCQTSSVDYKSSPVRRGKIKSRGKSFQFEPKYQPRLRDQIEKPGERSRSNINATVVPTTGRSKDVKTGSKQTRMVTPNEDIAPLDTTTFFQQLRNTMRTSMEALSSSSAYFDSVNRALNFLPEDRIEDASIQQLQRSMYKDKRNRPVMPESDFQHRASTSRCTLSNINRTCSGGARSVARDDDIKTFSLNRAESMRSQAPRTSYKSDIFSECEEDPQTSFFFETDSELPGPSDKLQVSSKCSEKEKKQTQQSILKARSYRGRNVSECSSRLNPDQTMITQKPQRPTEVKNIKTVSSSLDGNEAARCEPEIDQKPIKSIYLDKIAWASYLSQRRQAQDNKVAWDKSSSEEEIVGNPCGEDVTPQEEKCFQSEIFEKMPTPVVEPCVVVKNIEFGKEKEEPAKTSTLVERSKKFHESTMLPATLQRPLPRRDLDRHPIYLYGIGNRWNGQIQLETQSMKTAFQEIAAISSLLSALFLCWLPLHLLIFADAFCQANAQALWYQLATWLIYLNSMFNPFCFNYVNAKFLVLWQHVVGVCKA